MGLLHDIQSAVLEEGTDLGPILLKLRLLAARLGSQPLADWVKYESEGYPPDVSVPDYRIIPVTYTATFSGPFGSGISNAPIAPYLIEKFAGKQWNNHSVRQSIAEVDELLTTSSKSGVLRINAADLILVLQGKVYEDYACNAVNGTISRASFAGLRHSVRSRVLELTIELDKSIPEAGLIDLGNAGATLVKSSVAATHIAQQIIYGNVTSVSATGDGAQINLAVGERDLQGFVDYLENAGILENDARQLGEIVASEGPESNQEPLGGKASKWLVDNLKKAANGTWKIGVSVATDVIKSAVLKYYGLK